MADAQAIAAWFLAERGITAETLRAFNVGVTGDRVTFPYPNGVKERPDPTRPLKEGERRFYAPKGWRPEFFCAPDNKVGGTAWLVEGETDTMRLWQEMRAAGKDYAAFGLSGIETLPEELERLTAYERVYVVLDNDQDYLVQAQVERAWRNIRATLGGRVKRVHLPRDSKDICEFFELYDLETLGMQAAKLGVSRFQPIDFTLPPPPVNWFMENWIAMGDVTLLVGLGGLGKSWITMALALAAVTGQTSFLDQKIGNHGPCLYVDEENPQDVVYDRLLRMGLDPTQHSAKLRYLWNQGIKLDRNPDALIEEAYDFRPAITCLDSLTRLHSKEENVSGDIAPLFNDAIKPLAREVGSAVVLIHHHDKNATGPRGSTDIRNSVDAVIECYAIPGNPTKFRMKLTKSRRVVTGTELVVEIVGDPGQPAQLKLGQPLDLPF